MLYIKILATSYIVIVALIRILKKSERQDFNLTLIQLSSVYLNSGVTKMKQLYFFILLFMLSLN